MLVAPVIFFCGVLLVLLGGIGYIYRKDNDWGFIYWPGILLTVAGVIALAAVSTPLTCPDGNQPVYYYQVGQDNRSKLCVPDAVAIDLIKSGTIKVYQ